MTYAWRRFSFDVDDRLVDQSSIVLVAPAGPDAVGYSLTVARDGEGGDNLKGYVDTALRELAMGLSGFRLVQRDDRRTLGGKPAVVITHQATTPEGQSVTQVQGFAVDPDGQGLIVVTATATAGHEDAAKKAFEALWTSWRAIA